MAFIHGEILEGYLKLSPLLTILLLFCPPLVRGWWICVLLGEWGERRTEKWTSIAWKIGLVFRVVLD